MFCVAVTTIASLSLIEVPEAECTVDSFPTRIDILNRIGKGDIHVIGDSSYKLNFKEVKIGRSMK